jgi:hypothetical protein
VEAVLLLLQVEAVLLLLQVDNIKPVINRNTDLDNVDYLGSTIVLKKYTDPSEVNGELITSRLL